MKNAVFWDVAPCRYSVSRHFGETYRLHLQGSSLAVFSTFKMKATRSSETSVHTRSTWGHIPQNGILRRLYVQPKYQLTFTRLHGVISQKTEISRQYVSYWLMNRKGFEGKRSQPEVLTRYFRGRTEEIHGRLVRIWISNTNPGCCSQSSLFNRVRL
jgi:hypothetical protein